MSSLENKLNAPHHSDPLLLKMNDEVLPGFNSFWNKFNHQNKELFFKKYFDCDCNVPNCYHFYALRRYIYRLRMALHSIKYRSDNKDIKASKEVLRGYAKLNQFVNMWLAYDDYKSLFIRKGEYGSWKQFMREGNLNDYCDKIRGSEKQAKYIDDTLIQFLKKFISNNQHLYPDQKERHIKNLDEFMRGKNANIIDLARQIRNAYNHGSITANVHDLKANLFEKILDNLIQAIYDFIKFNFKTQNNR